MEDRFNREKSLELKGVAIIFMFWLHLYGHDNLIQNGNYYTKLLLEIIQAIWMWEKIHTTSKRLDWQKHWSERACILHMKTEE